jgi:hypothetical protein
MYPFIDAGTIGFIRAFINAGGIWAGFSVLGLVVVGLDRLKKRSSWE